MRGLTGSPRTRGSSLVAAAAAVFGFAGIVSQAAAQVTTHNNRVAWQAAAAPNGGEDFNSFVADATFQNVAVPISNGSVLGEPGSNGGETNKIDVLPAELLATYIIDNSPLLLGDVVSSQKITIAFTTPVTAWGADFKGISDGGPTVRDTRISVYDNSNNLLGSVLTSSSNSGVDLQFYGFTLGAGQSASRLELRNLTTSNDVFGLDNSQFTLVPEPSSALAVAAATGALLIRRRRLGQG